MTGAEDGRLFDRRYRILAELGGGASGTVYKVEDKQRHEIVAVKVLSYAGERQRERLLRFRREFRAASSLRHPNVVGVHEFVTGRPSYFTMEYVDGKNVAAYLGGDEQPTERLNHPRRLERLFSILHQIAGALICIHQHDIVHRDLKPENVLVTEAPGPGGPAPLVKLMDFGLARDLRDTTFLTQPGVVLGTLAYVAPEQASGAPLDGRANLYALGVLLYRLLTGALPFTADSVANILWKHCSETPEAPRVRNPGVNRALDNLCLRLLRKDPFERPRGAEELLAVVTRAAGGAYPLPDVVVELGRRPAAERARPFAPRLVGRDRVLRALLEHLAPKGPSRAAVIGPQGVGKSRLLAELRSRAEREGTRVLSVRFEPRDPRPLGRLRELVAELVETPRVAQSLLSAEDLGAIAAVAPGLPFAAGASGDAPGALARLLQAMARTQPTLLLADDVEHADPAARRALLALGDVATPLAVVVAGADEAILPVGVIAARPPELSLGQLTELVRTMLGQEDLPVGVVEGAGRLTRQPGAAVALVRQLAADGRLQRERGRWRADPAGLEAGLRELEEAGLEVALRTALGRQLEGLEEAAAELLALLHVFGREAHFDLLLAASGREENVALDAVEALLRHELLAEGRREGRLHVASDRVDAVLASRLQGPRRGELAGRLLAALDTLGDDEPATRRALAVVAGRDDLAALEATRLAEQRRCFGLGEAP